MNIQIRSGLPVALVLVMMLVSLACAPSSTTEESATPAATEHSAATPSLERAREAAQMAEKIEKEPARLTEILEAHGMTSDEFQELLYKIAEDPELTRAYEAARSG